MKNWKRTTTISLLLTTLMLMAIIGTAAAQGRGGGRRGGGQGSLTEAEVESLNLALQDEYKAWATYDQVIQDFGEVSPFAEIRTAEARHAEALIRLFEKYGLDVPANEWIGEMPSFESLEAACEAGVQAEIENAALYEQLLASTDKRDLTNVFTNLQAASQEKHLPAFEECDCTPAEGGGKGGPGGRWNDGGARQNGWEANERWGQEDQPLRRGRGRNVDQQAQGRRGRR